MEAAGHSPPALSFKEYRTLHRGEKKKKKKTRKVSISKAVTPFQKWAKRSSRGALLRP